MLERFEGIVLFVRQHRENDGLVKIFTADFGTKMFFVKGFKKPNHALATQLIPFTANHYIGTVNQEGLSFLREGETLNFYKQIQSDYLKQAYGAYIVQLIDAATPDNQPAPALYRLLQMALDRLAKYDDYQLTMTYVELHLLRYFGFPFNFERCVICGETQPPFDFSMNRQGLLCQQHWHKDERRLRIAPKAIHIAQVLSKTSLKQIQSTKVSVATMQELRRLMDEIYTEFIGLNLKSKSYLQQIDNLTNATTQLVKKRQKSD